MKAVILSSLRPREAFSKFVEALRAKGILPKAKAVAAPREVGVKYAEKNFDLENWLKLWRSIPIHHYDSLKDEIAGIEHDLEKILNPVTRNQHQKLDAAIEGVIDLASYFVFNDKAILTRAATAIKDKAPVSEAALAKSKTIVQRMFNFLVTQKPANGKEADYCINPEAIRIKEEMTNYLAHFIPETSTQSDIGGVINNMKDIFENSRRQMGGESTNIVHDIDEQFKDHEVDECLPDILNVLYENAVEFNINPSNPDIKILLRENPLNRDQMQLIVSNAVPNLESLKGKNLEDLMRASSKHSDLDKPTAPNLKRRGLHLVKAMAIYMGALVQVDYRDERFNVVINIPKTGNKPA